MKVHQFLDHYGITENPFSQEDAQSDQVFQSYCLTGTHHSGWDKIFGDPRVPSTSIVFGEQGSGKTALRLQMIGQFNEFNKQNPKDRAFIVEYDDFNPFLDCFRERLSSRQRKPEKTLQNWQLLDHIDCILTLTVTRLANAIRANGNDAKSESHSVSLPAAQKISRQHKRDILLLATLYDENRNLSHRNRWGQLRRKLKFRTWKTWGNKLLGLAVMAGVGAFLYWKKDWTQIYKSWWPGLAILVGWLPYLWLQVRLIWLASRLRKQVRVVDHTLPELSHALARFPKAELFGQPMPSSGRGDERYEMLNRLQAVLKELGFTSIVVLMDRVDEPHLINGAAERMRDFLWPLFDNKFLKQPGMAFKLLLPNVVVPYLDRQEKEFYEKSRLDKQNMIKDLTWSGQGLYDVANDRIKACAKLASDKKPGLRDLMDASIGDAEFMGILDRLRAPRHLFKYLHRLLVEHCAKYTEDQPEWKIKRETLQTTLALFLRDLEAYDQKRGTG